MALALHAHDPYGLGDALSLIARLAAHAGRSERAVRLVAAGFRSWDDAMGTPSPNDIRGMELWLEPIRAELGNEAVERIWQDGYAMTREQALAFAANEEAEVRPRGSLTNREMEVAELLSEGLTNRQIADRLVLSERTIDAHLEHIRNKLGMRNRAQIATWVADQRVP